VRDLRDAIRLPGDGKGNELLGIGMGALTMMCGVSAMCGSVETTRLGKRATRIEGDATGVPGCATRLRGGATFCRDRAMV